MHLDLVKLPVSTLLEEIDLAPSCSLELRQIGFNANDSYPFARLRGPGSQLAIKLSAGNAPARPIIKNNRHTIRCDRLYRLAAFGLEIGHGIAIAWSGKSPAGPQRSVHFPCRAIFETDQIEDEPALPIVEANLRQCVGHLLRRN